MSRYEMVECDRCEATGTIAKSEGWKQVLQCPNLGMPDPAEIVWNDLCPECYEELDTFLNPRSDVGETEERTKP